MADKMFSPTCDVFATSPAGDGPGHHNHYEEKRSMLNDVLEALLCFWVELDQLLLRAAPLPAGSTKDDKYLELVARHRRYIPGAEMKAIVLLFYTLDAFGVAGEVRVRRLLKLHNAHMEKLAADSDYLHLVRAWPDAFLNARFPNGAIDHAAKSAVYYGRVALDATAVSRLAVEFLNKNQTGDAMNLLASFGFFEKKADGAYAAKLFLSTGKAEALCQTALARLARAVGAALGGARGVTLAGEWGGEGSGDGDARPFLAPLPLPAQVLAHSAAAALGLLERVKAAATDGR